MDSSTVQDHTNPNKAADSISEEFSDWYDSDEVCQGNNEADVSDFDRLFHASDEGNDNIELEENTADENNDSSEDRYDGESAEDYREIVSKVFSSELEGYNFYLDYAKNRGFGVRKDNLKYNRDDLPVYRKFCCSFAGFKRQREAKIREPRPSKRVGCPALLTIRFDSHAGIWYINNFIDKHNHKMATTKDGLNLLRSHRKIPDAHKARLLFLQKSGLRKHLAIKLMEDEHGGPENLPYTKKDAYNFYERDRLANIAKGDADTVLKKLKDLKAADPDFYFEFKMDDEGHLTHLFWADAQSREDYRLLGDVILFDSTYRLNLYSMPFVPFVGSDNHRGTIVFGCGIVFDETEESFRWLLRAFLRAMF